MSSLKPAVSAARLGLPLLAAATLGAPALFAAEPLPKAPAVGALTLEPTLSLVSVSWMARDEASTLSRRAAAFQTDHRAAADSAYLTETPAGPRFSAPATDARLAEAAREAVNTDDSAVLGQPAAALPADFAGFAYDLRPVAAEPAHASVAAPGFWREAGQSVSSRPAAPDFTEATARWSSPGTGASPAAVRSAETLFSSSTWAAGAAPARAFQPGVLAVGSGPATPGFRPADTAPATPSVYVSNFNTSGTSGNVPAYTAAGTAVGGYTVPAGFGDPEGVAASFVSNTLYVADANDLNGAFTIRTFNATTGVETQIGFANAAGLNHPEGLLLTGGNLLVANFGTNTILAFNPANGQAGTGFTSPTGLSSPTGLASLGNTLFVGNQGSGTVGAYTMTTGTAAPGFAAIGGLSGPLGLAVFGTDLFVASAGSGTVGEYNALTGAVINASFATGLNVPYGLAVLGNQLLVSIDGPNNEGTTVVAYGIPATATAGNVPTSTNANFITGLEGPTFLTVPVPEPGTWAGGALLLAGVGLTLRRRLYHA